MYHVPQQLISAGLQRGYRCPISGTPFIAFDPSKAHLEALRAAQRDHTIAIMESLDMEKFGQVQAERPIGEYQAQFRSRPQ